jgi:hypothetical protein
MPHASGTFKVVVTPAGEPDHGPGATLGRLTIDKIFEGPLSATSRGQMLTAMTEVKGSAGYVAIERVTGTLDGRDGSFALQHHGPMNRGASSLTLVVVPDSGSGGLQGIDGTMTIDVRDKQHHYTLDYGFAP